MHIVVVGIGYVGLVTATCLAEMGHRVFCYDIDEAKLARLRLGDVPIFEPGLSELVAQNLKAQRLFFLSDLNEAARDCPVAMVAVGTPALAPDGAADLRQVESGAQGLMQAWRGAPEAKLLVIKSTVPVGTCAALGARLQAASFADYGRSCTIAVASNPEFLKQGMAVEDFMRPDRIVVGSDDAAALALLRQIYAPFIRWGRPYLEMTSYSAEMTKYAANAHLAARISLMNELANLCEPLGADVCDVHRGIGTDRRLGMNFLYAGIGYGGSCFPKDVQALAHMAAAHRCPVPILQSVHATNTAQQTRLVPMLRTQVPHLSGQTVALWGLAFKPRTDDIRQAPAMVVLGQLLALGAQVRAFDPEAMANAQRVQPPSEQLTYAQGPLEACEGACALLIATEWGLFRNQDLQAIKASLSRPLIVDGRNLFAPENVVAAGFTYLSVGRAALSPRV